MDIEAIRVKREQYDRQRQEARQQRAELERVLQNLDTRIVALSGAIEALDELMQEEKPDASVP